MTNCSSFITCTRSSAKPDRPGTLDRFPGFASDASGQLPTGECDLVGGSSGVGTYQVRRLVALFLRLENWALCWGWIGFQRCAPCGRRGEEEMVSNDRARTASIEYSNTGLHSTLDYGCWFTHPETSRRHDLCGGPYKLRKNCGIAGLRWVNPIRESGNRPAKSCSQKLGNRHRGMRDARKRGVPILSLSSHRDVNRITGLPNFQQRFFAIFERLASIDAYKLNSGRTRWPVTNAEKIDQRCDDLPCVCGISPNQTQPIP